MTTENNKHYDRLVELAGDRKEEVNAAADRAGRFDAKAPILARNVGSGDELKQYVARMAIGASIAGLRKQEGVVADELATESAMLKEVDPRKVPAITNEAVAEKRAQLVLAKTGQAADGEKPPKEPVHDR